MKLPDLCPFCNLPFINYILSPSIFKFCTKSINHNLRIKGNLLNNSSQLIIIQSIPNFICWDLISNSTFLSNKLFFMSFKSYKPKDHLYSFFMKDSTLCPICNNPLRSKFNQHILNSNLLFTSRNCTKGLNHSLQFFSNSSLIHLLKFSLTPNYSKFIILDFINSTSTIKFFSPDLSISINKIILPDFPSLSSLKEKVDLILTFS
jgi:hypothetical protein